MERPLGLDWEMKESKQWCRCLTACCRNRLGGVRCPQKSHLNRHPLTEEGTQVRCWVWESELVPEQVLETAPEQAGAGVALVLVLVQEVDVQAEMVLVQVAEVEAWLSQLAVQGYGRTLFQSARSQSLLGFAPLPRIGTECPA